MPPPPANLPHDSLDARPSLIRRAARLLGSVLGLALLVAGTFYAYLQMSGNIHEVEVGRYYRSGQLKASQLRPLIEKYGIRSIINLRGSNGGTPWYEEETALSDRLGVRHIDYALSAGVPLTQAQMNEILGLLQAAPKPVLVHCEQGADRTGLITALYRLSQGAEITLAEQELSLRYGHFPYLLWRRTQAMDDSLHAYLATRRPTAQNSLSGGTQTP